MFTTPVLYGLRKNMKSQGSHFPDQVSKLTPLEYKSGALALKETCSGPWLMNAEHQLSFPSVFSKPTVYSILPSAILFLIYKSLFNF